MQVVRSVVAGELVNFSVQGKTAILNPVGNTAADGAEAVPVIFISANGVKSETDIHRPSFAVRHDQTHKAAAEISHFGIAAACVFKAVEVGLFSASCGSEIRFCYFHENSFPGNQTPVERMISQNLYRTTVPLCHI